MNKVNKFRDMSVEELEATHSEQCKELFHLKNQFKIDKKMEKPHLIQQMKKETARLLTVLNEKQRANNQKRS